MTLDFFNYLEQAPRILIIDDQEDERAPIIEVFKQHNVIQYDGSEAPKEKLTNIRLVFLDLHLGSSELIKNAISILNSHIAPPSCNGPFLLVLWTKHAEEKDNFETALKEYSIKQPDIACPSLILTLDKQSYNVGVAGEDVAQDLLKQTIEEALKSSSSLFSIIKWEHESIASIYNISGQLAQVSAQTPGDCSGLNELLKQLTKAYAGKHNEEIGNENFQRYLKEALNHILSDNAINAGSTNISIQGGFDQSHVFNTWLHYANPIPGVCPPGSVFKISDVPCINDTIKEQGTTDEEKRYRQVVNTFFTGDSYRKNKDQIFKTVFPIAVEITPPCDYAQNKKSMSRFLLGLAMPTATADWLLSSADYLFKIPQVIYTNDVQDIEGVLCFNFRFVFTSIESQCHPGNALFILRGHIFSDIQSRLSWHVSRPGHLSL